MNAPKKKAPAKKRAPAQASLIRYHNNKLKPGANDLHHPVKVNNPDITRIMPGQVKTIGTGLEVAIPPDCIAVIQPVNKMLMVLNQSLYGYQDDLGLHVMNVGQSMIELEPYQEIGKIALFQKKDW